MNKELPERLVNPLIARARIGQLPDALPLLDIATLLIEHRRVPGTFSGVFEGINFTSFVHQQVMKNLVKVQGYTRKEMSGSGIPKGTKEPIIHRDEIKTCLELAEVWPLEDGCLLANWWPRDTDWSMTKNERDELLKIIGVLTLALAETKLTYKKRSGLNKSAIVASVQNIIDAEEIDIRWKGKSKLYEIINNALDALEKSK